MRVIFIVLIALGLVADALATDPAVVWNNDVGAAAAPAVYSDGKVFIASADRYLRAFDWETGKKLWSRRFRAPLTYPPAVVGDRIYLTVLNPERKLFCLRARDGKRLWSVPVGSRATPPAVTEGGVVVGSGPFLILYGEDGETSVKVKTDAVDGVKATGSGALVAYVTGVVERFGPNLERSGAVLDPGPGRSYVLEVEGGFLLTRYAREALMVNEALEVVWRADLPGRATSPAAAYDDGYLIGCLGGGLVYLSRSGSVEWCVQLGGNVIRTPAVAGETAYVVTEEGTVYSVDRGGSVEEFARLGFRTTGALLYYEGKLLAPDDEGALTVFSVTDR